MARSGGDRVSLRDEAQELIEIKDELRQQRFRAEVADLQPATVRDRYLAAAMADDDESASFVRFVEQRYAGGWRGLKPESDEQIAAAVDLRRVISEWRQARVPAEVDHLLAEIDEARRYCAKLQRDHAVRPLNLAGRPDLASLVREGLALEQWEPQNAPEPEPAA